MTCVASEATAKRDLHSEIRVWLASHHEGSLYEIAHGIHAREGLVRAVLLDEEAFSRDQSQLDRREGPVVFRLALNKAAGLGLAGKRIPQHEVCLRILSDGDWHGRQEFFAGGVGQPNSRLSDLRSLKYGGHQIQKKYVAGVGWVYRLAGGPIPPSSEES